MKMRVGPVTMVFVSAAAWSLAALSAADRPNFLFIYTDDQRWDARMQAEFDRQAQAVDFRIPEFADPLP